MKKLYLTLAALAAQMSFCQVQAAVDLSGATYDNPIDATSYITNPNCDSIGGWTQAPENGWGLQSAMYTNGDVTIESFIEKWIRKPSSLPDCSISQVLSNMPAGQYRLGVDAIATQQQYGSVLQTGTYIYYVGPSSTDSTVVASQDGKPQHFNVDFVFEGGDMTIGFGCVSTTCNWVGADNFSLTYYGEGSEILKESLKETIAEATEKKSSGIYTGLQDQIQAQIDAAQAVVDNSSATKEEIDAQEDALESLMALADENKTAYANLTAAVDSASYLLENYDAEKFDIESLSNYLEECGVVDIIDGYTASTEDCDNLTDSIYARIQTAIISGVRAGEDATFLIANPTFNTGNYQGWSYTGKAPGVAYTEAEVFNHIFDVYQTFEGVPNGKYTLKAQAYLRTNDNATAYTNYQNGIDIKCYLYMNDATQPVCNIMSQAQATSLLNDGAGKTGDYETADGTWVPNGMEGAYYYLQAGLYDNEVTVVVTDNTLRLGVKLQDTEGYNAYWCLFDNFRLTYEGDDLSSYESARNDAVAKAEALYDDPMCADSLNALKSAVDAANSAATIEAISTALSNLTTATAAAETSIAYYAPLGTALDNAYAKVEKVKGSVSDGTFKTNYDATQTSWKAGEYADADIENQIANVKTFTNQYLLEDVEGTEENPADITFILDNADFTDNTVDNWTVTGKPGISSNCIEFFNTNFQFEQEQYGMKAGTYILEVQGFYRSGANTVIAEKAAAGTMELNTKYYINDSIADLMSIVDDATDVSAITTSGVYLYDSENNLYTPDNMATASLFFDSLDVKKYIGNTVKYECGTDASVLTFGIKKETTIARDWTIFRRFNLYYISASTDGVNEIEGSTSDNGANTIIYGVNGVRRGSLQTGVNIIKNGDKVRKVIVK